MLTGICIGGTPPIANTHAFTETLTCHAMLIPWVVFTQQIGLMEALEQVPIPQRQRDQMPQTC